MSRGRNALLFALGCSLAFVACSRRDDPTRDAPPAARSVAEAPEPKAVAFTAVHDASAAVAASTVSRLAAVKRASSIGHTSVVFKVELVDGTKAAFKPASRRAPKRFAGEIAAYELAQVLHLPNVIPAREVSIPRAQLDAALGGPATPGGKLLADEALSTPSSPFGPSADRSDDAIRGAFIAWVDKLTFLPLESETLQPKWRRWLKRNGEIPRGAFEAAPGITVRDAEDLARQVSDLVVFDYLTGNWDRWSGANVGWDDARQLLLFVDNDGAFFESPPKDALERNEKLLRSVERFSKRLVERLRGVTDAEIDRAIGAHVGPSVVSAVLARRAALLATLAELDGVSYFR